MSAAMTPGTQPMRVSRNTINTDPQPRSITAKGGKIIANSTCKQLISLICLTFAHKLCENLLLFFYIRKKKKRLLVAFFSFRLSLPCVFLGTGAVISQKKDACYCAFQKFVVHSDAALPMAIPPKVRSLNVANSK